MSADTDEQRPRPATETFRLDYASYHPCTS